jgi:4-diphosphocytidyl-2-C-methyl-D-erythritol kinase
VDFFSPAKLNLFFRVLGRREDGYHEIASLYQAVSLGDTLRVQLAESEQLTCDDPSLPCDGSNLILKAGKLFRVKTGLNVRAHFHLSKRIPIQSGLGGGSGNGATALWALNELAGRPASVEELCLWSGEIGSDVPFFFSQGTAYCTGRGEKVQEVPAFSHPSVWIAKPQQGLETAKVYKFCQAGPPRSSESLYFNDLEPAAFQLMPKLADLQKKLMELGFERAVMTGSGTAFFCMGAVEEPVLEGVRFYRADFLRREKENWY